MLTNGGAVAAQLWVTGLIDGRVFDCHESAVAVDFQGAAFGSDVGFDLISAVFLHDPVGKIELDASQYAFGRDHVHKPGVPHLQIIDVESGDSQVVVDRALYIADLISRSVESDRLELGDGQLVGSQRSESTCVPSVRGSRKKMSFCIHLDNPEEHFSVI